MFWKSYKQSEQECIRTLSTQQSYRVVSAEKDLIAVQRFLRTYFGDPPRTPILDMNLSAEADRQLVLVCENSEGAILGCIRYKFIGTWMHQSQQPIHQIDCFCIHPMWRKKGIGSLLLTALHNETTSRGMYHALFLKEGAPLSLPNLTPLYSSLFIYRKLTPSITRIPLYVSTPSADTVHHIISQYRLLYPDTFAIINYEYSSSSQFHTWRYYKKSHIWILAHFQDSHQVHPEDNRRILWCTGYFESPSVKHLSSEEYSAAIDNLFVDFHTSWGWVWADIVWFQRGRSDTWVLDGAFHWYTYQWKPSFTPKNCYCI